MDKNTPTSFGMQSEPAYSLEIIKEMYLAYGGDTYSIWHDYGNAFADSCRYYGLTEEMMKQWKE